MKLLLVYSVIVLSFTSSYAKRHVSFLMGANERSVDGLWIDMDEDVLTYLTDSFSQFIPRRGDLEATVTDAYGNVMMFPDASRVSVRKNCCGGTMYVETKDGTTFSFAISPDSVIQIDE